MKDLRGTRSFQICGVHFQHGIRLQCQHSHVAVVSLADSEDDVLRHGLGILQLDKTAVKLHWSAVTVFERREVGIANFDHAEIDGSFVAGGITYQVAPSNVEPNRVVPRGTRGSENGHCMRSLFVATVRSQWAETRDQ